MPIVLPEKSDADCSCEIIIEVETSDTYVECDLLSVREHSILKARLEELTGNLND